MTSWPRYLLEWSLHRAKWLERLPSGGHGTKLRLPDALVVATAVELRAGLLLTTDAGWPSLPIPVAVVAGLATP
jgi:hypothetical protein